jgi:hypothetical protein
MADQLYLSLWFPNFRLQSLPAALVGVMRQFALIAKDGQADSTLGRVASASAYPIDWTESPVYQRIFVLDARARTSADRDDSIVENAVIEATEQLHEDTAYEFEMRWMLWQPESDAGLRDATNLNVGRLAPHEAGDPEAQADTAWRLEPARVRITGFGPEFDEGSYEQNGHIRIDFGLDTPWTFDDQTSETNGESIDSSTAQRIQQNVEKLLAFTLSVEKHCGISSRLLWTESGEPLAEKLIARLQRLN